MQISIINSFEMSLKKYNVLIKLISFKFSALNYMVLLNLFTKVVFTINI